MACRPTLLIMNGVVGSPRLRSTTPDCGASRPSSGALRSCCRPTRRSMPGSAMPWAGHPVSVIKLRAMRAAGYDLGTPGEIPGPVHSIRSTESIRTPLQAMR